MLLKVDFSQEMFRWLFQPLYRRVLDYTKDMGNAEEAVRVQFIDLLSNNPNLYLVIDLNGTDVQGHCLFCIQGDNVVILQIEGSDEFIPVVLQYIELLPNIQSTSVVCGTNSHGEVLRDEFSNLYSFRLDKTLLTHRLKSD